MKRANRFDQLFAFCAAIWAALIIVLLVLPVPKAVHNDVLLWSCADKLVHAALFGVLYLLAYKAFRMNDRPFFAVRLLIGVSIYGVLCELLQLYLKERSFDVLDIIANIMGSLVVFFLIKKFKK